MTRRVMDTRGLLKAFQMKYLNAESQICESDGSLPDCSLARNRSRPVSRNRPGLSALARQAAARLDHSTRCLYPVEHLSQPAQGPDQLQRTLVGVN